MMRCDEIKELLLEFWDLPANDLKRKHVYDHVEHCTACAKEFAMWQQSVELIQHSSAQYDTNKKSSMSSHVMRRIYAEEGWREPIPDRIYSISYRLRRKLSMAVAFFLALFMLGFLYSIVSEDKPEPMNYTFDGLIPIASAVGEAEAKGITASTTIQGVPVASISDPFILGVNSIKTYPNYFVAFSLLGVILTLLVMNWFSRIKA